MVNEKVRFLRAFSCHRLTVWVLSALVLSLTQSYAQKPDRPEPPERPSAPARTITNPLAEEIVRTLKENPALLADAKSTIAAELTRRNYPVREEDLTDEKVFAQIRSNTEFRKAVAESLQARGYLMDFDEAGNVIEGTPTEEESKRPRRTEVDSRKKSLPTTEKDSKDRDKEKAAGTRLTTRPNPYRDVPSLAGLYRQYTDRPSELERFGAAFFHDDLMGSEVSSMEMPLGSDYVVGPGDVLELNVYGGYSAKLVRTIDHEGRIALPEAGSVLIGGMSLSAAQEADRKSTRLNSSHIQKSRMPSSA